MTQADTLRKMMRPTAHQAVSSTHGTQPRVVCITSGKGGVGKSNFTVNMAYALAKLGKKVLVLDADLNLANVDVLLGMTPKFNLHHMFTGEKSLQEVMVTGPGGIRILPGSSGIMELANLTENQKLYFLSEMEELNQQLDVMLIDTAAGINENVIYFNLAAQERIVLLTPEPTSLTDAYALIKVLSTRHDVKRFSIVVNQAESEREALAVFRQISLVCDQFLGTLSLDFLGHIPYDKKLIQAVRSQRLITDLFPDAAASQMIVKIARQFSSSKPTLTTDGNIKFFWPQFS
ncbi:MAG: MinD/ParA family protein [Desulfobulbaceae bacterium]|nr:MinD/ParA family protein [Desulfobulbaceae bacterium]